MRSEIKKSWNKYLDLFQKKETDIYYTEEYVALYEDDESSAWCVICQEDNMVLLMPFIRKEIQGYYDFETAYGYGGPIANTSDQEWIDSALMEMFDCFQREKYVCGFIRFHPLLNNADYCRNKINIILDRATIAVDTEMPEKEIWEKQISSKNRNMIRKGEKNGLVYNAEFDFASIQEFITLYQKTMKRLSADDFYFFSDRYYLEYKNNMKGKGFLGTVRLDGKLIAAALFMYSSEYGHYHLSGSDREYSSLGVNNFLLWNTICRMKMLGIREFHLGGGARSSIDDSLFKFKRSFSKNEKRFYIGKCVFQQETYEELCREWEELNVEKIPVYGNRLLKYRY